MASGLITSWQIDRETTETVTDFIFLGSKITADGDCSHEIKRCLLLGKKAMTNLDSILKCRNISSTWSKTTLIRDLLEARDLLEFTDLFTDLFILSDILGEKNLSGRLMSFLGVEASNCFTDKNGKGDVLNGFVLEVSLKVCSSSLSESIRLAFLLIFTLTTSSGSSRSLVRVMVEAGGYPGSSKELLPYVTKALKPCLSL